MILLFGNEMIYKEFFLAAQARIFKAFIYQALFHSKI